MVDKVFVVYRMWTTSGFGDGSENIKSPVGFTLTEDEANKWIDENQPKYRYTEFFVEEIEKIEMNGVYYGGY